MMLKLHASQAKWQAADDFLRPAPSSLTGRSGGRWQALLALLLWGWLAFQPSAQAQDLEPRRWTHLPTGLHILGIGVGYTEGDIFLDPLLEIEDASYELANVAVGYVHSFGMFGKSARVDVQLPFANGRWAGLLSGEPASTRRRGMADPRVRLSVLLYGGPAQDRQEFATGEKSDTVVGAALSIRPPLGEYFPDLLINLGQNRWIFRPQLGVTHTRGRWTYEVTGSVFLYTDNDDFRSGNELKNDPLWALQGHAIYTFRPGLWASVSTAYGDGADAFVNGVDRNLKTQNWLLSLALGLPINRQQGVKLAWIRSRTQEFNGIDSDSLLVAWQHVF